MKLQKKYGLLMSITMVVGIVIGSGVFFKAQTILDKTNGNVSLGIIAWVIGGINMLICALAFAVLASKHGKINGLIDYAEATVGKKYADFFSWFLTFIYYPAMTSVLVWVSARYTGVLFNWDLNSANVMTLSVLYLLLSLVINALAPKIAEKVQISTTIIKLIPLVLMAIVGLVYGLINTEVIYEVSNSGNIVDSGTNKMQILIENFKVIGKNDLSALLAAVVASAFAYEGWIVATSINGELKNAKKNLPIALIIGSLIIMGVYIFYYIGVLGGATSNVLIKGGTKYAFLQIFGDYFGTILNVFVVISCFGTLNGLMVANTRTFYTMAERNVGFKKEMFKELDKNTNTPVNSAIASSLIVGVWLVFFYAANLTEGWFGSFKFDSSELPIITIYAMYIPIFIMMIVKQRKELGIFKGIILPVFAILSCIFMVFASVIAHTNTFVYYLITYALIMLIGIIVLNKNYKEYKKHYEVPEQ